jgi:hypothetical protein
MKNKITLIKRISAGPVFGGTASPAGAFDTSARLDTRAAIIRNVTSPVGTFSNNWDTDRADMPTRDPNISDRPE